ncbi:heme-binding domain-containing protein [Mangrovimonas sp. AS39]|uniref:heme-binding domain-containing protein n=1 Tax=Mangrovimonas TaxID=1211036 RepID=UPI001420376D|nr:MULTISPECIES: heme-binding domain-containing protein [Mangrovimonas]MCF1191921.1 heme-binding domain-containing protein [Mangrovimonas futianensis]MCF1195616.1 heme-binding domain-containing protein [Mangrovimonas futianensis]MCF1422411.1 heme-binding domain-containing protein [Mangrovimonas futianensis]NIK92924.1 heme-binding domain-containing protein [Mangrovimonas sp. CR14]
MKIVKKILLVLLVIFIVAQFFGPEKNDGDLASIEPFLKETMPPEDVKVILKETCYDCHSSFTQYPWYNNITPVNYWMAEHVEDGKKHLDFSKWADYSVKKKDHKLEELIEMVEEKEMPLESYTWIHSEARLTDEQIESVNNWAKQVRMGYSLEPRPE